MNTIVLADDHVLLRKGLASLVQNLGYTVVLETDNGQELIDKLQAGMTEPDLVLMDINMPIKDGYEATRWIKENKPLIKVLALSMYDDENAIMKMLRNGARGYILKDSEPGELRAALDAVVHKGYYYSELVTGKLIHSMNKADEEAVDGNISKLTDREIEFLRLACSELTYKEIAAKMHLSPRTIDGYRDALFEKLSIKTRTGLAIYAIKNSIIKI
jgi:two-component system, NarL family, invasion response regulator UvrY